MQTLDFPPWEDGTEKPGVVSPVVSTQTPAPSPTSTPIPSQRPDIMSFFPLKEARKSQDVVIREIDKAFSLGYKVVILEAPVGSGKSAIATTFAKSVGTLGAHMITPRKSLQDQYFDDFGSDLVLMKGRNAYPCTIDATPAQYKKTIALINTGRVPQPSFNDPNCAVAPCTDDKLIYKECTDKRPCPYTNAMELAQNHSIVVHNIHSFIFQSSFTNKFNKRELLIIDEAHEIESTVRSFTIKKIYLSGISIQKEEVSQLKTWSDWEAFLIQTRFLPEETERDAYLKGVDSKYRSARDKYLASVADINSAKVFDSDFSVEVIPNFSVAGRTPNKQIGTTFEFVPVNIGGAVRRLLIDFGEKVLLMSGTIYNKEVYCRTLGIDPEKAYFIKTGSSFPVANRPIYCVDRYQVDTSHANWNDNFGGIVEKIQKISSIFHDVKGLIHTPSYLASEHISNALNNPRYVTHTAQDFQQSLSAFFSTKEPKIFLSPICQQGVDFKGDRARFQIILRVPYQNTSSNFVQDKLKNDFAWYNYQALIIFGQQIGRINRSDDDFGATFLVDSRFHQFIRKNAKVLPQWLKDGIVWK